MLHTYDAWWAQAPLGARFFALDWKRGELQVSSNDGPAQHVEMSLLAWLKTVPNRGDLVVIEQSFESYEPDVKAACIAFAAEAGIVLRAISQRGTANTRAAWGDAKSDALDAEVIRHNAKQGRHLKTPRVPSEQSVGQPDDLKTALVIARVTGYATPEAREAAALIEDAAREDAEIRRVFCDDLKTIIRARGSATSVAQVALYGARAGWSRNDFDRALGLYDTGYPNKVRSDLMYHRLPSLAGFKRYDGRGDAARKAALKMIRRTCRRLFAAAKVRAQ